MDLQPAKSLTWSSGNAIGLVVMAAPPSHRTLFADHPDRALALVDGIIRNETGGVLIDVVSTQDAFLEGLTARGWSHERPFQRMRLAAPRPMPRSCHLPSPDRNTDKDSRHASQPDEVRGAAADRRRYGRPRPSAGARRRPRPRYRPSARADALLHRRRRRRACGRCPHHAIRHPRSRAVPAGAGTGRGDRGGLDEPSAGAGRRPGAARRGRP